MQKLLILFFVIINILNSVNAIKDNCVCNCNNCDNATITLNIYDDDDEDVDAATCDIKQQLELLQATNKVLLKRFEALSVRHSTHPSNCAEAIDIAGTNKRGLYSIQLQNIINSQPFLVYCDQNIHGDDWMVIQRRFDGSINFYRTWSEYKVGFGNLNGEFWIGLDKLHALTTQSPQELLIIMEDFDHDERYAKYSSFAIGSESEAYVLNILGKYTGTAGDSLTGQALSKFTTKDVDNDKAISNCAVTFAGAWWYNKCHESNLNGEYLSGPYSNELYARGVVWEKFRGYYYALKFVQMMIRPKRQ